MDLSEALSDLYQIVARSCLDIVRRCFIPFRTLVKHVRTFSNTIFEDDAEPVALDRLNGTISHSELAGPERAQLARGNAPLW